MPKLTLKDPGTNYRSVAQIQDNNSLIEAAIENTISRDGTSPNQMEADLDLNSNRITNLGAPVSDNDAARKVDIVPGADGALWYTGSGAPASGLGINNDMYLDESNGDVYGPKASGTWPASTLNITGPDGDVTASANETITGDWAFTGSLDFSSAANKQAIRQALEVDHVVATLAALRAATKANLPDVVLVQGRAAEGDGGGGVFVWDSDATASDDDGHVIAPAAGGAGRWVRAGLTNTASLESYGLDASGVEAATDGSASYIDMAGASVTTTRTVSAMATPYFNGTLLAQNADGNNSIVKPQAPLKDYEIERPRTKFPVIDFKGKNILWLGTSIPHQGDSDQTSYPHLTADALEAHTTNNSWSGSHATFDPSDGASASVNTIKALSMTDADQQALAAAYPGSNWDDADPVTKATKMTCDYRIRAPFAERQYDVVVLDHNHNDRRAEPGTLGGVESTTITGVTFGSSTVVAVSSAGTLAVGDAVALDGSSLGRLRHAAGRVSAVSGTNITVEIDTSTYSGSITSGTLYKYDRATLFGSFEFLCHFIRWCANDRGLETPQIVLCGAPSEYTNNTADEAIFSNARYIKQIADAWALPFFDIGHIYDVKLADHQSYFPDDIHPTTLETRQALTNHWVAWFSGGIPTPLAPSQYLQRAADGSALTDQRPAEYSSLLSAFWTPAYIREVDATALVNEDWSSGFGSWTTGGTGTAPVISTAPWDAGASALDCDVSEQGYAQITGFAAGHGGFELEFQLYLPTVTGLTTQATARTVTIMDLRDAGSLHYSLAMLVKDSGVRLRLGVVEVAWPNFLYLSGSTPLQAGVLHTIKIESVREESGQWKGAVRMLLDGEELFLPAVLSDDARSAPNQLRLGVTFTNVTDPADVYIGNVLLNGYDVYDFRNRFTGSWVNSAAQTVTVVNGIITDVS